MGGDTDKKLALQYHDVVIACAYCIVRQTSGHGGKGAKEAEISANFCGNSNS